LDASMITKPLFSISFLCLAGFFCVVLGLFLFCCLRLLFVVCNS